MKDKPRPIPLGDTNQLPQQIPLGDAGVSPIPVTGPRGTRSMHGAGDTGSAGEATEGRKVASKKHVTSESSHDRDANLEFMRAETEDDDGYDPWSDRPASSEPLFTPNPWD